MGPNIRVQPRLVIGLGWDSNVFYEDQAASGSGTMTVTPAVTASTGTEESRFRANAGLSLLYREFLSGVDAVRDQRSLGVAAGAGAVYRPGERLELTFGERFSRTVQTPYAPGGSQFISDTNNVALAVKQQPGGPRLTLTTTYDFGVTWFEDRNQDLGISTNYTHTVGQSAGWLILQRTEVGLHASVGAILYQRDVKSDSYPVRAAAFARTQLSGRTQADASVGYGRSFYSMQRTSDDEVATYLLGLGFRYRAGARTSVTARYARDFQDSFWANYATSNSVTIGAGHALGERLNVALDLSYQHRAYGPPPTERAGETYCQDGVCGPGASRNDHGVAANAAANVALSARLQAGVHYSAAANLSDFAVQVEGAPAPNAVRYVKHSLSALLTMAY